MAGPQPSREEDLRRLLTDAIEVQLASLRAGIGFWSEWIEQTSGFVQSATKALATINSQDQSAKDVLLEVVDAGRASLRSMTEIPRHTATRFIEELDKLEKEKAEADAAAGGASEAEATASAPGGGGGGGARAKGGAGRGGAPRPKRAGRVKP